MGEKVKLIIATHRQYGDILLNDLYLPVQVGSDLKLMIKFIEDKEKMAMIFK